MADERVPPAASGHGVPLREATRVWGHIGLNSFGGPAGQIAVMHREIVDRHRWVSERRFLHALNFCMILPGPEAQQLATYLGWLMHGRRGAVIAGLLFIVPGFVAMMAVSIVYAMYGSVGWVAGLLFGIQAAVVAIVVEAVIRIGRRTLRSAALRTIAVASFVGISFLTVPFPIVIIVAALVGWLIGSRRPGWLPGGESGDVVADERQARLRDEQRIDRATGHRALRAAAVCAVLWLAPVAVLLLVLGPDNVFSQIAVLFSKSAVLTFGGAYAVLGYITQEAVVTYGWISSQDMITGLGLAETTPGPLIMVVQFVGFLAAYNDPGALAPLVAGVLGATLTVWVTFVPCFLFIFLGAPYVERLRGNRALTHALTAVGAAVAGVVLNLAVWFALHTVFGVVEVRTLGPLTVQVPQLGTVSWPAVAIGALAALLIFRLRLGTLRTLGACAGVGAAIALLGWG